MKTLNIKRRRMMLRKASIVLLSTAVVAIVALFAASEVRAITVTAPDGSCAATDPRSVSTKFFHSNGTPSTAG